MSDKAKMLLALVVLVLGMTSCASMAQVASQTGGSAVGGAIPDTVPKMDTSVDTVLAEADAANAFLARFPSQDAGRVENVGGSLMQYNTAEDLTVPAFGEGPVHLGTHATDRHDTDAWIARAAAMFSGPGNRWDCPGADKVYVITRLSDGRIAMTVIGRTTHNEITSFLTRDVRYIAKSLTNDGCGPNGAATP
jgi:hypothetical protein